MSIWDWLTPYPKSNAQRAAEAEAMIRGARASRAQYEREQVMREIDGQAYAFTRGPEEAKAYHFALELVRDRGPSEASRIADRVVFFVQMLSREPR